MADEKKQADKEALKAQKQAEKEALKAKKERIKQSKPKKSDQGNIFVRMGRAIKKFFKDFRGTCKKIIWPDRKTVLKNSLIVFVTVLIVGVGIWIVDFAFTSGVGALTDAAENYAAEQESIAEEEAEAEAEDTEDTDTSEDDAEDTSSDTESETE
ncbi:MAG: preprotein translocase subunit SecE [Clostridiales bacterium]|nr:preprotein translocase subunit SecE [Clostridiales bacterium]MCD7827490.1 preprotein translocase subunit SecE [Clostridiales bacterium]